MMSAVATSACDASQGTKAGFSRSPSMRMSESMSQGIFCLPVELPYLGFDCVRRVLVGIKSFVGPEQAGGPLAVHEICIRSEEHTSELQSLRHLVCRLL